MLSFLQKINSSSPCTANLPFGLLGLVEGQHTVQCTATYYNKGRRTDPFSSSFFYKVVAGSTGTSVGVGARSGGCWILAKDQRTCYYTESLACVRGCPNQLICNNNFDFNSINGEMGLDYCVEKIKQENKVVATIKKIQNILKGKAFIGVLLVVVFVSAYVIDKKRKEDKNVKH